MLKKQIILCHYLPLLSAYLLSAGHSIDAGVNGNNKDLVCERV